jgi:aminoglycoside phosphotransferase (APT) family kinase protein
MVYQGRWLNLFSLYVNARLVWFSNYYCAWYGIRERSGIYALPFGLLVKTCSEYPEQEARGTMIARKMGVPVPRILLYGESEDGWTASILMTHIPGVSLSTVCQSYSPEEIKVVLKEVGECLARIRSFPSPYGEAVCGPLGGTIYSKFVPWNKLERQPNCEEFYKNLYKDGNPNEGPEVVARAKKLQGMSHRIVLGHGDLAPQNIMVKDGHLTGIIDWEYSGW